MKQFLNKENLLNFLKGKAVKAALIKLLGSAALGGFRSWLIKFVVEHLFDKVAEPIIELGLRKANLVYNRIDGKVKIKKLNAVDQKEDEDEYDDIVTDILS